MANVTIPTLMVTTIKVHTSIDAIEHDQSKLLINENWNDIVEVTMKGKVDPVTGMVINIKDLKECLQVVMENLDHRNLDKDVEYFFNKPSTTENLAIYIWNEFQKVYLSHANAPVHSARLYRVKICETDSNHVEYMGEETNE
jgi:6-pyruvoyltetrahydropterin/6-carboxytetrahydropterin synthase